VDVFLAGCLQAAKDRIQMDENIAEKFLNIKFIIRLN